MSSGVLPPTPVLWRLAHRNGQTASCAIVYSGKRFRVQRWLNDYVAGADEFATANDAQRHAEDIRRHFERRGFREDDY